MLWLPSNLRYDKSGDFHDPNILTKVNFTGIVKPGIDELPANLVKLPHKRRTDASKMTLAIRYRD